MKSIFYLFIRSFILFPIYIFFFRGVIEGRSNVPKEGPLLIVANHGSHLDPPLLGIAFGRQISFMAKQELFKVPILGFLITCLGAYPVKRGSSDRNSLKLAINLLVEGRVIGIFLDGKRQPNGRVNKPLSGAAMLSARSGAKLIPVAILNSHRAFKKGSFLPRFVPIHIRIGEPLSPPLNSQKDNLKEVTSSLQKEINLMLDEGISD